MSASDAGGGEAIFLLRREGFHHDGVDGRTDARRLEVRLDDLANDGAFVRALVGKDLPRSYEFSGRQLIVKSARPDEHWRVVWERY